MMITEQFYSRVYIDVVYRYLLANVKKYQEDGFNVYNRPCIDGGHCVHFEATDIYGKIVIWKTGFIELSIERQKEDDTLLYLHFYLLNLLQFQSTFDVFYRSLKLYTKDYPYKIGVCCHTGVSASDFVKKIKRITDEESLLIDIDAFSFYEFNKKVNEYDHIYLAPTLETGCIDTSSKKIFLINEGIYKEGNYRDFVRDITTKI